MRRIIALLGTAAAATIVAVLAVGAHAAGTPFRSTFPIDEWFNVCSTGDQIHLTGSVILFANQIADQNSGYPIYVLHELLTGTGTGQTTRVTYHVTVEDHLVLRGDTEDTSFTTMETQLVQFRPIGGGAPLFGHIVVKVVYNKPGTFSFSHISGDEACLTLT